MRDVSYECIEVIILNSLFLPYNTTSSATLLSMEDPILFMMAVLLVIEINNDNKSNNNSNGQIININEKIKDNKKINWKDDTMHHQGEQKSNLHAEKNG